MLNVVVVLYVILNAIRNQPELSMFEITCDLTRIHFVENTGRDVSAQGILGQPPVKQCFRGSTSEEVQGASHQSWLWVQSPTSHTWVPSAPSQRSIVLVVLVQTRARSSLLLFSRIVILALDLALDHGG